MISLKPGDVIYDLRSFDLTPRVIVEEKSKLDGYSIYYKFTKNSKVTKSVIKDEYAVKTIEEWALQQLQFKIDAEKSYQNFLNSDLHKKFYGN